MSDSDFYDWLTQIQDNRSSMSYHHEIAHTILTTDEIANGLGSPTGDYTVIISKDPSDLDLYDSSIVVMDDLNFDEIIDILNHRKVSILVVPQISLNVPQISLNVPQISSKDIKDYVSIYPLPKYEKWVALFKAYNMGLPPSKFKSLFSENPIYRKYWTALINFIDTRKPNQSLTTDRIKTTLDKATADPKNTDFEIYNIIRNLLYPVDSLTSPKTSNPEGRVDYRIKEIKTLLESNNILVQRKNMLDIGCAEGFITGPLGKALGMDGVYGCDTRAITNAKDFIFMQIQEDSTLPYDDNMFSIIFSLMVLHHIKDYKFMLSEAYRVTNKGGYFIVREHDCNPGPQGNFIDLVHGLYAISLGPEIEDLSFPQTYWAHYFTRAEISNSIIQQGFKFIHSSPSISYQGIYFSIYQK